MGSFIENHKTYTKINTLYKRDEKNNIVIGDFSRPEFWYLYNSSWSCEEKIDGTNVFTFWDGRNVEYHGKTENADIPVHLYDKMKEIFTVEKLTEIFPIKIDDMGNEQPLSVRIYGEGYGAKIQKGNNYISNGCNVILFDVEINGIWLERENVEDIANRLGINICPLIGIMTLKEAEKIVSEGFKSTIAENTDYDAEGLVCKPIVPLFNRMHERVVVKIKTRDYRKLQR